MANYTINSITGRREFEAKHGPLVSYKLTITGDDGYEGDAELSQKPETPAPTQGQVIEGTLDQSNPKFPPKLKKAQAGGFGGGKGKSKADQDSIERSVAYKGAVDIACATIAAGAGLDEAGTRTIIEHFFDHGLALVQGKTPSDPIKEVFPNAEEAAPSNQELVAAYSAWLNAAPDAEMAKKSLALQKTALGIEGDTDAATADQKVKLLHWFRGET